MQVPARPADDPARVDRLRALNILDTLPEERFDRLTRMARRMFDVPIALVSLVDENRQWFKSRQGLEACETSRDLSFCGHAILNDQVLIIPDARNDERFSDNPLVSGEPYIRFYAGCPLALSDGAKVGTLCLIDTRPRTFDNDDRALLQDLACMAQQELEAMHLATLDELTQVANRRGFEALAEHGLSVCRRLESPATLLFFDLNGFKAINDTYGHAEGDLALARFARVLRTTLRDMDIVGRLGGDEFVALLMGSEAGESQAMVERFARALAEENAVAARGYDIRYSVGIIAYDPDKHAGIRPLLAQGDSAMYAQKQASRR